MGYFFSSQELQRIKHRKPHVYTRSWLADNTDPIYIYGAGWGGAHTLLLLRIVYPALVNSIAGFLDNDGDKVEYCGFPVFSADTPLKKGENPLILVAPLPDSKAYRVLVRDCQNKGYRYIKSADFIYPLYAYMCNTHEDCIELEHNEKACRALGVWADSTSRVFYRNYLRRRFADFPEDNVIGHLNDEYTPAFMPIRYYRNFLDCGAYTGDTFLSVQTLVKNKFEHYYAFECDPFYAQTLEDFVRYDKRISLYTVALWSKRGHIEFYSSETDVSCPRIVSAPDNAPNSNSVFEPPAPDSKTVRLETDTIDNLLSEKPVSMIKMDIEGAELPALQGAVNVIASQRPAMMISSYHSLDDFFSIPLWIHDLNLNYDLFLRKKICYNLHQTICYAVPR